MHKLMQLTYDYDALEPHIDAQTMEIHHTKHHQTYVDKLNQALEKHPEHQGRSIIDLLTDIDNIPDDIRTAVRNHGGGVANHNLFFTVIGPGEAGRPEGDLANAISSAFGGFDSFQNQFTEAALGQFGSGWGWLTIDADDRLRIETTANQGSPLMQGRTPLLGVDVWEHAYYLKYQNRRPEYVKAFWNVVRWEKVAAILASRSEQMAESQV
jgi:Fe-Mn family superoxide dismutase